MTYNQLGFAFTGLRTISFASIDAAHKKTGAIDLTTGLSFGLDTKDHTVTCTAEFSFEKKKDQPFLILKVQSLFKINNEDFLNKMRQDDNSYLVTQGLATHFAVLTVGSARGILHSKTEGTKYNQYLLPTIDIKGMIQEDIVLNLN